MTALSFADKPAAQATPQVGDPQANPQLGALTRYTPRASTRAIGRLPQRLWVAKSSSRSR
jgi:hypothetical protein